MAKEIASNTVAVQFLNYMLHYEDVSLVFEYNIDETYFPGYEQEFNYIINHYQQTKLLDGKGCVPDKVSFLAQFPEFPLFQPPQTPNTLYRTLLEQKCYSMFIEELQKSAEKSKVDSFEAIEYTRQSMIELSKFANKTIGSGKDLIRQAGERLEDYIKRIEVNGLIGISTGDKRMDETLHGWLPEDLVVVLARTNEGKSWLLMYYLIQAVLQGKKVGCYSGEMSHLLLGFRFDTMYKHFGNSQLIGGNPDLGSLEIPEVGPKTMKEYREYINALIKGDLPEFRVFTQKDLGNKCSVNTMRVLQDRHAFDIWGLDQLSLMSDDRNGREERIRYANISEDLARFTEEYQIPILTVHQANRKSADAKKKDPNASPQIEDSFGSDAIMQNATRVISFMQIANGAKAVIKKNRYGTKGKEFFYTWNINFGIFKPMDTQELNDGLF